MSQLFNKSSSQFEEIPDESAQEAINSGNYLDSGETIELFNTKTNLPEFIPYDEAPQKILSQNYQFISGTKIPFLNESGETVLFDPEDAYGKINEGLLPSSYKEFNRQELEKKRGTPAEIAKTALEGGIRGATLGLGAEGIAGIAKKGIELSGGKSPELLNEYIQAAEERQAVNPATAIASEILTPIGGIIAEGTKLGKAAKILPSNILFNVGEKLGSGAEKAATGMIGQKVSQGALKSISGATNYATQAAIDGAVINANQQIKDYVNHDKDFSAESFFGNTAINTLFGGVTGAVAPHVKDFISNYANSFNKLKTAVGEGKKFKEIDVKDALQSFEPSRSEISPGKFGHIFEEESPGSNIYTLKQGNKQLSIDKSSIENRLINYDNPEEIKKYIVDNVGNKNSAKLIPDKLIKSDMWNSMGMADFYAEWPSDRTIDLLNEYKKTKGLAEILSSKRNILKELGSQDQLNLPFGKMRKEFEDQFTLPLYENVDIPESQVNNELKEKAFELFNKYKKELSSIEKSKKGYQLTIDEMKNGLKMADYQIDKKLKDKFSGTIGHMSGGKIIIHGEQSLPEESMLRNVRVYNTAMKQTPKDTESLLKVLGANKSQLEYFNDKFTSAEKVKIKEYLEGLVKKSGGIIPDPSSIKELIKADNELSKEAIDSSLNKMANALLGKYGYEGIPNANLHSSGVAKFIRNQLLPETIEKGMVKPGMNQANNLLNDFVDYYQKLDKTYTPKEWIDLRRGIDDMLMNSFKRDYTEIPISKQKLWNLRHFMENKLEDAVKINIPERTDLLKEYNDAKFLYRITHDQSSGESLLTVIRDSEARDAAKKGVKLPNLLAKGALSAVGYGAGGLPGAVLGFASERFITDPILNASPYFEYQFYKRIYPKVEKSFKFLDKNSKEFIKGFRGINISTQSAIHDYKDVDYILRNKNKLESAVENPKVFINSIYDKMPDSEIFSPELGAKIAKVGQEAINLIYEKMPKNPYPNDNNYEWRPDPIDMAKFKRYVTAILKPETIFENFGKGYVTQEEIESLKRVYPTTYLMFKRKIFEKSYNKKLNYQQQELIRKVFGNEIGNYKAPMTLFLNQDQKEKNNNIRKTGVKFSGQEPTKAQKIEAR